MRRSQFFLPTTKETPGGAQIVSHRLMLRAGMVTQTSSGIYAWLPLGLRVLNKIQEIICQEQDDIGAQQVLMPTVQSAELWRKSGRYDVYGKEMLRFKDRHEREMLYGPTNEEQITEIFSQFIKSYRDMPKNLYQIQWKFRDEVRPRYGVMRGREFLMKDGYSFDMDFESAKQTYMRVYEAYLRTFYRMGLRVIPVRADSGAIGGDMSHEFQVLAPSGESTLFYDAAFDHIDYRDGIDYQAIMDLYAAVDEKHDPLKCPIPESQIRVSKGIEVGHIFYFGTKYSEAFGAQVMDPHGRLFPAEMGSYGIGVSRLVGAIIEANFDEDGIVWPESVAPFRVGLINLKPDDKLARMFADQTYEKLLNADLEVLYDDRNERSGVKFNEMDLLGIPWQVIIGSKAIEQGMVEIKQRRNGVRQLLDIQSFLNQLAV